jgi:hypothetical protein
MPDNLQISIISPKAPRLNLPSINLRRHQPSTRKWGPRLSPDHGRGVSTFVVLHMVNSSSASILRPKNAGEQRWRLVLFRNMVGISLLTPLAGVLQSMGNNAKPFSLGSELFGLECGRPRQRAVLKRSDPDLGLEHNTRRGYPYGVIGEAHCDSIVCLCLCLCLCFCFCVRVCLYVHVCIHICM